MCHGVNCHGVNLGPMKEVLREANLGSVRENFRMARTVHYRMPQTASFHHCMWAAGSQRHANEVLSGGSCHGMAVWLWLDDHTATGVLQGAISIFL